MRRNGATMTAARMRRLTGVRYPWSVRSRTCFLLTVLLLSADMSAAHSPAAALQPSTGVRAGVARRSDQDASPPRTRHFVTVSYDWHYTQPLHFGEHPLADLLGTEVASVPFEVYEYRTRDEATLIDVVNFSRRQRGATVTLYPLGMSTGSTLALRGSIEPLPAIDVLFVGPAPFGSYTLRNARALDASAGVYVADRAPGWGLGSHAFVLAGIGRITSDVGDGRRYFAEGGGGVSAGPIGVDLSVKFAWNRLAEPVEHRFLTVPITLRGTVTF
jgi:hypothetical protein